MQQYIIEGGHILKGNIKVHGSKNSVLPMMAAAVINGGISVIENVPDISDVYRMAEILKAVGCRCSFDEGIIVIDSNTAQSNVIDETLASKVRTSVLLCGPMLARFGRVITAYPGGCAIGSRPIDIHLSAFEKLGAVITDKNNYIEINAPELKGCEITLPFPSVGATQNIMMAAAGAEGDTVIMNAAREPEVYELGLFMNNMGIAVTGMGSNTIVVRGTKKHQEAVYRLNGDRIVTGTYMAACAAAGGSIKLTGIRPEWNKSLTEVLETMGCDISTGHDYISVSADRTLNNPGCVITKPYPGFPTDLQSQLMSVMCTAMNDGIIEETVFESRYKNIPELLKMGAYVRQDGRRAYIKGTGRLKGTEVISHDLRGGAALVIAGLAADGITTVMDDGFIKRGYEDIRRDLCLLGANIK